MRTTVDLTNTLAIAAKKAAIEQHTTLKNLIEQGLRLVLQLPKKEHALEQLKGLGKTSWSGIDADAYVQQLRSEWD